MADDLDDIKKNFPMLDVLTNTELDAAIERGGLLSAFVSAHVKKLSAPPKVGRPKKNPKPKKVIQRRGRKSAQLITPTSSVTQVAELADGYKKFLGGSAANAAKVTLIALTGKADPQDIRRVAKMMSDLSGRKHDREVRARRSNMPPSEISPAVQRYTRIVRF